MSLQKKPVDITFTRGADTGHDGKLVIPSKFTRVENLEVDRVNSLRQRPGFTSRTLTAIAGANPSTIRRLSALGDEVLIESNSGAQALLANRTVNRNVMDPTTSVPVDHAFERGGIEYTPVASSAQAQIYCDAAREAVHNRYECYAWCELVPNSLVLAVHYKVIDFITNAVVLEGVVAGAAGAATANPRVVVRNQTDATFYIYHAVPTAGVDLSVIKIVIDGTTQQPTVTTATAVLTVKMAANAVFDAAFDPTSDRIYVVYRSNAGGIRHVTLQGSNGTTELNTAAPAVVAGATTCISVVTGVFINPYGLAIFTDGVQVYASGVQLTGGPFTPTAETQIDAAAPVGARGRVAAVINPNNTSQVIGFWDQDSYTAPVSPLSDDVHYNTIGLLGVGVGALGGNPFARSVQLAGRPVTYTVGGFNDLAVPVGCVSSLQQTGFLIKFGTGTATVDAGGVRVLARMIPSEFGLPLTNRLPTPCAVASNAYVRMAHLNLGRLEIVSGSVAFTPRVAVLTWNPTAALSSDVLQQRTRLLSGACPHTYDGVRIVETGFNVFPEGLTAASRAGGSMAALGRYSFVMRYEWRDAKGVLHVSAPSVPVAVNLLGADQSATVRFPFLRLTEKPGGYTATPTAADVKIAMYRTEANGTVYYRDVAAGASDRYNLMVGYAMGTWISDLSDTNLIQNDVLHAEITDGTLDPEPFPSHRIACEHQTRTMMVCDDLLNTIQPTDARDEEFFAPVTSSSLQMRIPMDGGKITALASMDEKLIVFCERRIYYIFGEGPDRLGLNNGWSQPQVCSSNVGLPAGLQDSVVLTPDGLWFYSSQNGLRLLTRGLTIAMGENDAFLGREADGFFDGGVSAVYARVIEGRSQVRFYAVPNTGSAFAAVWDYQQHLWSKFTGHNAAGGAVVAGGKFFHSDATGLYESSTTPGTQDAGVSYQTLIETGWISMGGIQGFQRVYKLMLLIDALRSPTVKIETGYDYNETYSATFTQVAPTISTPTQYEYALPVQKCEAVRFKISFTDSAEAVRFTGMSLLIGVKGGLYKLPSNRRL